MESQTCFLGKKKTIVSLSSAGFAHRVVKVNAPLEGQMTEILISLELIIPIF